MQATLLGRRGHGISSPRLRHARAWVMLTSVSACANNVGPKEFAASQVLLFGRVQTIAGTPVAGALVGISHQVICGSGVAETNGSLTNSEGRYRHVFTILSSANGCVRLTVAPTGFAPDSVTLLAVPFRPLPGLDSVETAIILH